MTETETVKCTNARSYGAGATVCRVPFSILTFNVYPGPPVPYTASDLYPQRIADQIKALRALDPDIVCLQELYCDRSFAALCDAFPDYDIRRDPGRQQTETGHSRRRRDQASLPGIIAGAVFLGAIWCFSWRPALLPLAAAASLWAGAYLVLPQNSGLLAWLSNRGTGLAIMVRRSRGRIVEHCNERFATQTGDPLNLVAQRGYSRTTVALHPKCECGPRITFVFNTHLNALGAAEHRAAQASELAKAIRRVSRLTRIVVCGDFNEAPTLHSGVRECLEGDEPHQANLMIADPAHLPTYCPELNVLARGNKNTLPQCLDHIYFKPGPDQGLVPTDQTRVVFTTAPHFSDHFGVVASFE